MKVVMGEGWRGKESRDKLETEFSTFGCEFDMGHPRDRKQW